MRFAPRATRSRSEYRDTETKRRAAIVAESAEDAKVVPVEDLDPETRERLELRGEGAGF